MSSDEYQTASENEAGDNLQEIEGIGEVIDKALNKIGIYRFADFLRYDTSEQLQQALEETGEKIPLWKIKKTDWLVQAKTKVLAQEAESKPPSPQEEPEAAAELQQQQPSRKEVWEQYVGFNLYFEFKTDEVGKQEWRTLVFKSLDPDSFNGREEFPNIEPAAWVNWILEEAKLPETAKPVPFEAETTVTTPSAMAIESVTKMEILDVQTTMLPPSSSFPEKRLNATVRFQLSGVEAERLTAEGIPFRVEVHTVDLESRASILVASGQSQLQPNMFEYVSHQAFPFPEIGRYELCCFVLLLPPAGMVAYHRGPTISIVP
jgi:hypothetical protein